LAQTAATRNAPSQAHTVRTPTEHRLQRGRPFHGDLRDLPQTRPVKFERPEFEEPEPTPMMAPGTDSPLQAPPNRLAPLPVPGPSAQAPAPNITFDGLDFANWGAGQPTDQNGDVGPNHYIQTINSSIGIF